VESWKRGEYSMDQAIAKIEERAEAGEPDEELNNAVRYVDRHAHKLYSRDDKDELWKKAQGSWELRLGAESGQARRFVVYPDFRALAMAYVTVEEDYFGKGIAQNPEFVYVAMGGPSKWNPRTRQFFMNYEDFFLNGRHVPDWDLSYFMRGYARNWYSSKRVRPPLAFTIIACNDKVLVVRGSKTGGMAIFRRIPQDMTVPAYGPNGAPERRKDEFWKPQLGGGQQQTA